MYDQSRIINFIDPKWDQYGGFIEVKHRKYRLLTIHYKYPRMTSSQKAYFLKEGQNPLFVPASMTFIYDRYQGAGLHDYMLYVSEKIYDEKLKELKKHALKDRLERLFYTIKEYEEYNVCAFTDKIIQIRKRKVDRIFEARADYLELKAEFF